jgi:uncharacterized delta-60 repeat protein
MVQPLARSAIIKVRLLWGLAVIWLAVATIAIDFNSIQAAGQDGAVDPTFKSGSGANNAVNVIAVQPDGKILIGGFFSTYNGTGRNHIARLNSDGSPDTSFNPGVGANNYVQAIALQADGKILIGGAFTTYNAVGRNRVARLNTDGSLDTSFDPGAGANGSVNVIAVQPDGKILIGGFFSTYNGTGRNHIARLNSDGSLDTDFLTTGAGANNGVQAVAVQLDGKILIGGNFTTYNGTTRNYITRLNANGSLDTGFNPGSGTNDTVEALALQPDGKILIGGFFSTYNGIRRNHIARLNSDGSLDTNFLSTGTGANSTVYTIVVQPDGKILIAGFFSTYNGTTRNYIARLNPNGSLDTGFLSTGTAANSTVQAIALQADGKILIGGFFSTYNGVARNGIARLNADGSLDTNFNPGSGTNNTVNALALQADGKIFIGGSFTSFNGVERNRVARLNSDGSLDTSFLSSNSGANATVNALAVQADGKVLIGGAFEAYNGVGRNRIARLNPDGSLDADFNPGIGANDSVYAIVVQADGKVLIGGSFTSVDTYTQDKIARLENTVRTVSSVVITSSPNPSELGQTLTFTATTTPITATGTVRFTFGGSSSVTSTLGGGMATYVTNTIPIGQIGVTATYNGDTKVLPSTSPIYIQTVTKLATNITVTSAPNPSVFGETSTFTATVSPAVATGTVTFTIGTTNVAASFIGGVAIYVTNTLPARDYFVTATYSGSSVYSSSVTTGQYTHTVTKAATSITVTSTTNPSVFGQSVIFTATVSPTAAATGTVTFTIGTTAITATLFGGNATYVTNTLAAGTYNVTASYGGNSDYNGSISSPYTYTVDRSTPSITVISAPNPSIVEQTVTFTATVSLATTGTVTFTFGGSTSVISTLVSGVATYVTNTLPLGITQVMATYSGNANFLPNVSPIYTHTVAPPCNPLVVTTSTDNGASTCGTFSYALLSATSGMTVTFTVTNVTFTGVLTPSLQAGVVIDGGDVANGVTLDGGGGSSLTGDGLTLAGGNKLINLTIKGFGGRGLVVPASSGSGKTNNKLDRVKVVKT